jgi:hypothetical protein
LKPRTRRSIRDAALLLMFFVLAATVRITPPPPGDTDLIPTAQASQQAGLGLPAMQWTPQVEEAAAALPAEYDEFVASCGDAEAVAEAMVEIHAHVEVETESDESIVMIRTGSEEAPRVRMLRLDTSICSDVLRGFVTHPGEDGDAAVPAGRRTVRIRAALAADRDSGCS